MEYTQTWTINVRNRVMTFYECYCRLRTLLTQSCKCWKKNEKFFTYDRNFKFFRIHFFLFIPKQARQHLFYCNSTVHSLVIAMRQNVPMEITVWLSDLKSPFKLFFRVNKNTTLLALQRSRLLRLNDDGKDKRFPVVGRRVGVSQQKSFFWNWNQQQVFNSVSQSERWVTWLVPKIIVSRGTLY